MSTGVSRATAGIVTLRSRRGWTGRILVVGITEPSYKGHRYPSKIIDHCVWLYFRFTLSFRDIEEIMLERGVVVSYETVRRWCAKFGQPMQTGYVTDARAPATSGISTKCLSGSTVSGATCGGRSTRTASSSTCWCSPGEMLRPPSGSSGSCSRPAAVRAAGADHRQAGQLPGRADNADRSARAGTGGESGRPSGQWRHRGTVADVAGQHRGFLAGCDLPGIGRP